jgi:hypothetical protein
MEVGEIFFFNFFMFFSLYSVQLLVVGAFVLNHPVCTTQQTIVPKNFPKYFEALFKYLCISRFFANVCIFGAPNFIKDLNLKRPSFSVVLLSYRTQLRTIFTVPVSGVHIFVFPVICCEVNSRCGIPSSRNFLSLKFQRCKDI